MQKIHFIFYLFLLIFSTITWSEESLLGKWMILNDHTGKPTTIVELFADGDELKGRILKTLNTEAQNQLCSHCLGEFKNKPINGMVFLWGLKPLRHDKWGHGSILDTHTGKVYHAQLKHMQDKLYVRYYVGVAVLGKTQIWKR